MLRIFHYGRLCIDIPVAPNGVIGGIPNMPFHIYALAVDYVHGKSERTESGEWSWFYQRQQEAA